MMSQLSMNSAPIDLAKDLAKKHLCKLG
uniref:Uncharacterized protein n=1 Tax=Arundo donax TaxID=35708 RepID=A0A0A9BCK2_ARUDO